MTKQPDLPSRDLGLFSRIRGRLKHSETQADTSDEDKRTLAEQLVDAQAYLARVKELPESNWRPRFAGGQLIQYSVDAKDNAIAYAKADVAELRTKIRLSQRLRSAVSKLRRGKNAPKNPKQRNV